MTETYYDLLGVGPDASSDEIEAAYRERLTEVHPDVSDDPDAGEQTKRLIEARDTLTDAAERDRYDRLGHERYAGSHGSFVRADDSDVAASGDTVESAAERTAGSSADRQASTDDGSDDWATADGRTTYPGSQTNEARTHHGVDDTRRGQHRNRAWRTQGADDAYAVGEDRSPLRTRLFPPGPSLLVLFAAFALYPLMLWAAVFPPFPPVVNVVLGICLVATVVFLQSMPEVGAFVFGTWAIVLPLVLWQGFGVEPGSIPGLVAIAGTVLPLGLSLLTLRVLRH